MRRNSVMSLFAVLAMACGDDGAVTSDTLPGDSSSSVTTPDDTTGSSVSAESSSGGGDDTTAGETTAAETTAGETAAAESSSSSAETTAGESTTAGETTSTGTTEDETTEAVSVSESSSEGDDLIFIVEPDGGVGVACDIWEQDCPPGEKCNAWANDGGGSWNATACFPIAPAPVGPGEECTVEGSGVSGVDNCDIGSMCWGVDTMTNLGTCVALCEGTPASPTCDDAGTQCVIANDGVLILCLPFCDPLTQTCSLGDACYPIGIGFACAPDASGADGLYGDPCEFLNVCDPMLFCAPPDSVPGCVGASGCCSEFCDVADPNASMDCAGAAGGQECVPWFEEGQAPPGFENVGACAIPA